jgi:type II secretory pathway component PulK
MPSLNFKPRFAAQVTEGSKPHTIRAWRKKPFQAGDNLSFFTGMRTKQCRRLRPNTPCIAATPIKLNTAHQTVFLGSRRLTRNEVDELARKDGFDTTADFWKFFQETHGRIVRGQLIAWRA